MCSRDDFPRSLALCKKLVGASSKYLAPSVALELGVPPPGSGARRATSAWTLARASALAGFARCAGRSRLVKAKRRILRIKAIRKGGANVWLALLPLLFTMWESQASSRLPTSSSFGFKRPLRSGMVARCAPSTWEGTTVRWKFRWHDVVVTRVARVSEVTRARSGVNPVLALRFVGAGCGRARAREIHRYSVPSCTGVHETHSRRCETPGRRHKVG